MARFNELNPYPPPRPIISELVSSASTSTSTTYDQSQIPVPNPILEVPAMSDPPQFSSYTANNGQVHHHHHHHHNPHPAMNFHPPQMLPQPQYPPAPHQYSSPTLRHPSRMSNRIQMPCVPHWFRRSQPPPVDEEAPPAIGPEPLPAHQNPTVIPLHSPRYWTDDESSELVPRFYSDTLINCPHYHPRAMVIGQPTQERPADLRPAPTFRSSNSLYDYRRNRPSEAFVRVRETEEEIRVSFYVKLKFKFTLIWVI